jgi:hypothetical protein
MKVASSRLGNGGFIPRAQAGAIMRRCAGTVKPANRHESFDDLQSRACRKAGAWRVVGMYVY